MAFISGIVGNNAIEFIQTQTKVKRALKKNKSFISLAEL